MCSAKVAFSLFIFKQKIQVCPAEWTAWTLLSTVDNRRERSSHKAVLTLVSRLWRSSKSRDKHTQSGLQMIKSIQRSYFYPLYLVAFTSMCISKDIPKEGHACMYACHEYFTKLLRLFENSSAGEILPIEGPHLQRLFCCSSVVSCILKPRFVCPFCLWARHWTPAGSMETLPVEKQKVLQSKCDRSH